MQAHVGGAGVIDPPTDAVGDGFDFDEPARNQGTLAAALADGAGDVRRLDPGLVDVGQGKAQRHGHERGRLRHRFGAGVAGDIGIARAVDDHFGPDRHQAPLGADNDARQATAFHDGIGRTHVDQVAAADFVQGVEQGHLQVLHVAPDFVLAEADGLVAVGLQFFDDQFVDLGSRLAAGSHLVQLHPHGPCGHAAEERVVLHEQGLCARAGRPQRRPDAGRAAADHENVDRVEDGRFRSGADVRLRVFGGSAPAPCAQGRRCGRNRAGRKQPPPSQTSLVAHPVSFQAGRQRPAAVFLI